MKRLRTEAKPSTTRRRSGPPAALRREDGSEIRPVHHDGGCGERVPCPRHGMLGPYLPAEKLHNGTVLAHDCGGTWRPRELLVPMNARQEVGA